EPVDPEYGTPQSASGALDPDARYASNTPAPDVADVNPAMRDLLDGYPEAPYGRDEHGTPLTREQFEARYGDADGNLRYPPNAGGTSRSRGRRSASARCLPARCATRTRRWASRACRRTLVSRCLGSRPRSGSRGVACRSASSTWTAWTATAGTTPTTRPASPPPRWVRCRTWSRTFRRPTPRRRPPTPSRRTPRGSPPARRAPRRG